MSTALITGASSGIGHDLARLLARDGHDLVVVARRKDKLQELACDLEAQYRVKVRVIVADLAQMETPTRIAQAVEGLDVEILVNNAGYGLVGSFADTDLKAELEMIQVNITSLTHLTKLLLPSMVQRGRGRILNVASIAAFYSGPFMAVYYATKGYVLLFSEAVREELAGTGVTVTVLCPGPTATGFADAAKLPSGGLLAMIGPMSSMGVAKIGYRAMKRGKGVVVTGLANKLLVQSMRIGPRALITKLTRAVQRRG